MKFLKSKIFIISALLTAVSLLLCGYCNSTSFHKFLFLTNLPYGASYAEQKLHSSIEGRLFIVDYGTNQQANAAIGFGINSIAYELDSYQVNKNTGIQKEFLKHNGIEITLRHALSSKNRSTKARNIALLQDFIYGYEEVFHEFAKNIIKKLESDKYKPSRPRMVTLISYYAYSFVPNYSNMRVFDIFIEPLKKLSLNCNDEDLEVAIEQTIQTIELIEKN